MRAEFDKQKLYARLAEIPRGRVITYGRLAGMLGNPAWARAVGNALHENPDGDRYPCYRVVNSRGALSRAYAFGGIAAQERRLVADGVAVEMGRVDLARYASDGVTRKEICGLTEMNRPEKNV